YLLGCVIGYGVRRIIHAARGTHRVVVSAEVATSPAQPVTEILTRPRSTAARLAASVDDQPSPLPAPSTAATVPVPAMPGAAKPVAKPSIVPAAAKPASKPTPIPATRKP